MAFNSSSYLRRAADRTTARAGSAFGRRTPELNSVPDANLTHYLEDVDLPADALQLVTVIGTTASGQPALLGAYIHIPSTTLQDYAARATRGAAAVPLALLHRYGAASTESALAGVLTFNNSYINPLTTAVALCFHHPEVMNLNTTLGANTLIAYIQNLPADCTDPDAGVQVRRQPGVLDRDHTRRRRRPPAAGQRWWRRRTPTAHRYSIRTATRCTAPTSPTTR